MWRHNLRVHTKLILLLCVVACSENIFAFSDSTYTGSNIKRPDYYIDDYQQRIDLLDGTLDGRIDLGDSTLSVFAEKTYFGLIDSIRILIDKQKWDDQRKKLFRDVVYTQMRKITPVNVYNVKRWDYAFKFMLGELNALKQKKLYDFLTNNISTSFRIFNLFKNEVCADSFLIFASA